MSCGDCRNYVPWGDECPDAPGIGHCDQVEATVNACYAACPDFTPCEEN